MSKIHVLDNNLINKIAAGEVIERPASVVKELVENSIDAGASQITIEIKDGGINLIKITDNGRGIHEDELKTAFLRHATSKLSDFNDLENILTLGFRGEALSSIASVSQVEVITKTKDASSACRIELHGGSIINHGYTSGLDGTIFIMKNLFYNTPARRKFLKKPAVESGYVSDIINKIALGHPHISFKYINNGVPVIQTSGNNDIKTTIFHVYGKDIANKMLPLQESKNSFSLKGMVGKPELNRGNRNYENFFINGRYIKSTLVQNAVEDAFQGRLMGSKFPVFVIDMTVPASSVDVNVHPTKLEVRFANEDFIYDFVKKCIEDTLKKEVLIPNVKWDKEDFSSETKSAPYKSEKQQELEILLIEESEESLKNIVIEEPLVPLDEEKNIFYSALPSSMSEANLLEVNSPAILPIEEESISSKSIMEMAKDKLYKPKEDVVYEIAESSNTKPLETPKENEAVKNKFFNSYKIVGQLFNTYWIIEEGKSMYLIDQHAAHERALYEELTAKLKGSEPISQRLLQPIAINANTKETQIIKDNLSLLEDFGFELEEFGENTFALRSVPFIFKSPVSPSFFMELIDMLSDKSIKSIYETKLDKLASMSCKAAIKGNDKLSYVEAKALIEKVLKLENPFSCPHGRPTIIEMSKYEIEKKFKRIT